ncbi:hypothetical protein GCM10011583_65180 [Streptomyces camponoticapitis]|uniref:DUF4232 domain-containing protein n=2 Tax=Streptomyces camponoticapitis TaxID=1616125 RepID=A0ABQ2ESF3_9ACTN|nr:hypothetical protein GCM10011583_65180 [Streptomyces camponoticapitis]
MVALTATLTACDSGADTSADAGKAANAGSAAKDNDVDGAKDDYYDEDGGSAGKDNDVDGAKDDYYDEDGGKDNDVDGAKQDYYAKPCDNGDLNFTVKLESQAGGYYLVTAKAKPGVVCTLEGAPKQVMFGSDPDTVASNAEGGSGDAVKLKGSTAAYFGVNPKSTDNDDGKMFETLIVSASDDAGDAGQLDVESVNVDKPQVSNWHADSADVVTPFL